MAQAGSHAELRKSILERAESARVKFLRLQFTDILGVIKNVEMPDRQFEEALDGHFMFDGSSIEGFVRIEEIGHAPQARPLHVPGVPVDRPERRAGGAAHLRHRQSRRHAVRRLPAYDAQARHRAGRRSRADDERRAGGRVLPVPAPRRTADDETHDSASYFDLAPVDLGEDARRAIVHALEQMGMQVEAAHHEVAHGQHEIDFRYADVLATADNVSTFRFVVKYVAQRNGLHATFMPKPIFGQNGVGMHTHQSLFRGGDNAFFDATAEWQLSATCLHYIGGLLRHAKGCCAITNPLVNSYKRLVPGYEAPTAIAWTEQNRTPMVRVPAARGVGTRIECRMPDPAVQSVPRAGGDAARGAGRDRSAGRPRAPVNKNICEMSHRERRRLRIDDLPANLNEAFDEFEKNDLVRETLGEHIFQHFLEAKREEWADYIRQVSPWEMERYLGVY